MKYPFFKCTRCEIDIAETSWPITPATKVPVCPKCLQWDQVDVVIGDTETVLDSETVIFDTGVDD